MAVAFGTAIATSEPQNSRPSNAPAESSIGTLERTCRVVSRKTSCASSLRTPANTSVVHHANRLLALWEGGQPHELDPVTLATLGRYDYDGALRSDGLARWLAPEPAFSAHPKRCPKTNEMFNFGLQVAPSPILRFYRIDAEGKLASTRHIRLPGRCLYSRLRPDGVARGLLLDAGPLRRSARVTGHLEPCREHSPPRGTAVHVPRRAPQRRTEFAAFAARTDSSYFTSSTPSKSTGEWWSMAAA